MFCESSVKQSADFSQSDEPAFITSVIQNRATHRDSVMKLAPLFVAVLLVTSTTSCSKSGTGPPTINGPTEHGSVRFVNGFETDPRDHGRPVQLIGAALGVSPDIFRAAFSRVIPAGPGPPTPFRTRANKKVLMDALAKHGVTNERLDEASDYYRYRPQSGELWTHTPATATAILQHGNITGFKITNTGSGYNTAPAIQVNGFDDLKIKATIEFGTDLKTNGKITALTIIE
jgi:hypothetical protein